MSSQESKLRLKERQREKGSDSPSLLYDPDLVVPSKNGKFYYHIGTENTTFIKLAKLLQDSGIKNSSFHLKLYDPRIAGLDPYDGRVSQEHKVMMLEECRKNFWYYAREVIRIPVPGGYRQFNIHRGNAAELWCLLRNFNVAIVLPRQNFKTVSACVLYSWLSLFATSNSEFSLLNKKFDDAKNNLKRIKDIRDSLPEYLQLKSPKDLNNKEYILCDVNNNKIVAKNSAISEEDAEKLGRGCTQPIQYYDEMAFLKYNKTIYGSSAPAQSEAALAAKENGKPYHKLITTTPGDLGNAAGLWSKSFILNNAAVFREEFYDWKRKDIIEYIEHNSINGFLYIHFSWKQIGRSNKWYKQQCSDVNGDELRIRREINCEWFRGSEAALFDANIIKRAREVVHDPIGSIHPCDKKYYCMNIYKNFDFRIPVLIGVDVANGEWQDCSAITVCDASTLEVLGVFQNNTIDPLELAEVCYWLLTKVFTNGILIPERNNAGATMIKYLLKTGIQNKIYWEEKEIMGEERILKETGESAKIRQKIRTKVYGIDTTAKTRPMMIDMIRPILEDEPEILHCSEMVEEIASLERKKNGKIEHSEATHDDITFSYLLCRYVWAYGPNLTKWNITKPRQFTNLKNPNITLEELKENRNSIRYLNKTLDDNQEDFLETENMGLEGDQIVRDYYQTRNETINENRELKEIEERKNAQKMNNYQPEVYGIDWNGEYKEPEEDVIKSTIARLLQNDTTL